MSSDTNADIQAELGDLDPDAQQRVLDYVLSLKQGKPGTPEATLAAFAGAISPDDLQLIQAAIEQGCEQVDLNEWQGSS